MVPSNQTTPTNKLWFMFPWKLEVKDTKHLAYQPPTIPQSGLDGDTKCEWARMQSSYNVEVKLVRIFVTLTKCWRMKL